MTAKDMRTDLLERVLAAHKSFYDIRRDYLFEGRTFPAFAEYHTYGEKYVLVKRAKLWEVNTHDFMFFECVDELDETQLAEEISFMQEKALRKVDAGPNHMSSALSLVIICQPHNRSSAQTREENALPQGIPLRVPRLDRPPPSRGRPFPAYG